MKWPKVIACVVGVVVGFSVGDLWITPAFKRWLYEQDLNVGRAEGGDSPSSDASPDADRAASIQELEIAPEADVLFDHEPALPAYVPPAEDDRGAPGGLVSLLAEFDGESFQPDAAGLYERTTVMWSQPEFLQLTDDEARDMLGLDDVDTAGWKMPGTLQEFLGGDLPTELDCRVGMEDERSQELLRTLCQEEAILVTMWETPMADRTTRMVRLIEAQTAQRDASEWALMGRLERVTTYKNWRVLARLWRSWSK